MAPHGEDPASNQRGKGCKSGCPGTLPTLPPLLAMLLFKASNVSRCFVLIRVVAVPSQMKKNKSPEGLSESALNHKTAKARWAQRSGSECRNLQGWCLYLRGYLNSCGHTRVWGTSSQSRERCPARERWIVSFSACVGRLPQTQGEPDFAK